VDTRPSSRLLHAAVDCICPWAAASARPRRCSCMPARHACSPARLLHQSRLRLPSPWFPASCTCPHFANSKISNWRPARQPRRCLRAVHALHPSILHIPLIPCHRDRSQAIWLRRLPTRQLCPQRPGADLYASQTRLFTLNRAENTLSSDAPRVGPATAPPAARCL
jgi:hypothetical protein